MPDAGVEVRGIPELVAGNNKLTKNIEQTAPRAMLEGAGRAAQIARGRVPRLTGRLASSVTAATTNDGAQLRMGAGLEYAGWIEFGGSRGRPRVPEGRYLYPAAQDTEHLLVAAAEQSARAEIGAMNWPVPSL